MDDATLNTGSWTVALGAATASGTWEGFRVSPLRRTAELHVDGALTVGEAADSPRDYALVLSHPALERDRVLVAGKGGTVEFGHDVIELLADAMANNLASIWLTDLTTGATSEPYPLPRAARVGPVSTAVSAELHVQAESDGGSLLDRSLDGPLPTANPHARQQTGRSRSFAASAGPGASGTS